VLLGEQCDIDDTVSHVDAAPRPPGPRETERLFIKLRGLLGVRDDDGDVTDPALHAAPPAGVFFHSGGNGAARSGGPPGSAISRESRAEATASGSCLPCPRDAAARAHPASCLGIGHRRARPAQDGSAGREEGRISAVPGVGRPAWHTVCSPSMRDTPASRMTMRASSSMNQHFPRRHRGRRAWASQRSGRQ
jgi:hypothetical protein